MSVWQRTRGNPDHVRGLRHAGALAGLEAIAVQLRLNTPGIERGGDMMLTYVGY